MLGIGSLLDLVVILVTNWKIETLQSGSDVYFDGLLETNTAIFLNPPFIFIHFGTQSFDDIIDISSRKRKEPIQTERFTHCFYERFIETGCSARLLVPGFLNKRTVIPHILQLIIEKNNAEYAEDNRKNNLNTNEDLCIQFALKERKCNMPAMEKLKQLWFSVQSTKDILQW